jgi:hypothetical protein
MRTATFKNLAAPAAVTATTTGSAVDVSDLTGNGYAVLNSNAMGGTTPTSNVKLQHSDDGSTNWVDTGFAFDQVVNAASYQAKYINFDGFKKFVRAVNTVTGTTPTQTYSVELVGTAA